MFKHKRVAIDFDGTLFEDSDNIEIGYTTNQELAPLPEASETTKWLTSLGFEILIFTCRPDYHRKYLERLLKKHNIHYDYILFYTKPRVDLYIDNKGFRFKTWRDTKEWIAKRLAPTQEPSTEFEKTLRKNKIVPFLNFINNKLASQPQVNILDVGCGSGDVFDGVFSNLTPNISLDAVEPDDELRQLANNKNIYNTIFTSIDQANLQRYDIICALGVLEHIADDVSFLNSLCSANSIYLTVPNAMSLHRQIGVKTKIIQTVYDLTEQDFEIGHKRYYDKDLLERAIDQSELRDKFIISNFGTTTFKFVSNSQMQQFEQLTPCFTEIGEQFKICGNNNFFGAELYCLMTQPI